MKLSLINESLTSEEMQILDAWNRGEIEKGDNLYDSAQDLFKKLGTQVMLSESAPDLKELKKHRQILDDEEKSKAKKAKAVWGDGNVGVWKSVVNGKTWYVSNTHRLYRTSKTLDGIIDEFHNNVKETS
jgi:hypothetical protein